MKENLGLLLSIIVPVYNVEEYIRPCIESIFRQGFDEDCFEVIIVNDGTKDHSMEVIQDIIEQHKNIIVLNQENQGLSVARNNGIAMAKGEYILMPDSDDLLIENSLNPLLEIAIEYEADLVVADYLKMNDKEIDNIKYNPPLQKEFVYKEKTGEQLFLEDLNPYQCYVWRTLFRREFLLRNDLKFVPGVYYQDVPFTHESYLKAQRCIKTSWLLNIYRIGHESAT
jgi:Glycosyltransferases involved in cell wall biogenesis